jgi:hypothetical protein
MGMEPRQGPMSGSTQAHPMAESRARSRVSSMATRQFVVAAVVACAVMMLTPVDAAGAVRFSGPHVWKNWPKGAVTCINPGHSYYFGLSVRWTGSGSSYSKTKWTRTRANGNIVHFTSYPQWAGGTRLSFDGFGMPFRVLLGRWRAVAMRAGKAIWSGKIVVKRC